MISGVTGLPYFEEESLYKTKEEDKLGRDAFMKLFLAQMHHQDPLNPMDTTQFSAQLAQFSSLEQLFNINDNLETLQNVQSNGNRFQALDLIGKEIKIDGNLLSLEQNTTASGGFTIDSAAECMVFVYDENGEYIREIPMGMLKAGYHSFEWDGRDESGEMMDSDIYGFRVEAVTESGLPPDVETNIKGLVDRVDLTGDDPLIYLGEIPINLSQVTDISLPKSTTEEEVE